MAKAKEPGNWYPIQDDLSKRIKVKVGILGPIETILAIDPGTKNLACAYLHKTEKTQFVKTTKFEIPSFSTTFEKIAYLDLAIRKWLDENRIYASGGRPIPLNILFKESVAHGYAGGVADAGRVQHMIELLASSLGIPFMDVNPTAMRAFMKSKSKSDTKLNVYKKYHVEFASEDECDVFAIAMTGLALISGEYAPKKKK